MDLETPYRSALAALTVFNIGVRLAFHRRAGSVGDMRRLREEGRGMFFLRLAMVPWLLAPFIYLIHPPLMAWASLPLPSVWRWIGVVWSVACSALLWWVHRSLDANFSPALRIRTGHTLVAHGPYRWVRHPMYSMGVMAWLAAGLAAANWFIGLGGLVFLVHSWLRIPHEEAMMREAFGEEYRAYQGRTGRLLPKLTQA